MRLIPAFVALMFTGCILAGWAGAQDRTVPIETTDLSMADSILGSGNANPQLSNIPGMLLVGGAVMIVKDGARAGVLGVAGAPGGHLDEACAFEGINAIQ